MASPSKPLGEAMQVHLQRQETTAHNIANALTPGFKRVLTLVEAHTAPSGDSRPMPAVTGHVLDLGQGALRATHNTLDVAVEGEGFFTVSTPQGMRYTRNGTFALNENRLLVTPQGHPVLGTEGEIQVPSESSQITISASGEVRADNALVGTLALVAFDRPEGLRQAGASLFTGEGAMPRAARGSALRQGFLEQANVDLVRELVGMIATMRDYEACARSRKAIGEATNQLYAWARS